MNTVIYIADTSTLQNPDLFNSFYHRMPSPRQKKIDRFRFESDKKLSLGVGVLLKAACKEFGIENADEDTFVGKNGKEYLKNYPYLFFSLSHSGERAMCVFSETEVGCDVEKIDKLRWPVAERVLSTDELSWLKKQEEAGKGETAFTRIWTLKESFLKALGFGLAAPFELTSVSVLKDGKVQAITYERRSCSFSEPDLKDGYRYSCCMQDAAPDKGIIVRQCDFTTLQLPSKQLPA